MLLRGFYTAKSSLASSSRLAMSISGNRYNRFHDPSERAADIQRLRELHVEMDEAVKAAYGCDLALEHDFHETRQGVRFTLSERARREVLDLLLELNHARYKEEVAQGLHEKASRRTKKARAARAPRSAPRERPPSLFGAPPEKTQTSADPAEAILACLRGSSEPLGRTELLARTGIDPKAWRPAIQKLLDAGQLIQEGERRGARYRLKEKGM